MGFKQKNLSMSVAGTAPVSVIEPSKENLGVQTVKIEGEGIARRDQAHEDKPFSQTRTLMFSDEPELEIPEETEYYFDQEDEIMNNVQLEQEIKEESFVYREEDSEILPTEDDNIDATEGIEHIEDVEVEALEGEAESFLLFEGDESPRGILPEEALSSEEHLDDQEEFIMVGEPQEIHKEDNVAEARQRFVELKEVVETSIRTHYREVFGYFPQNVQIAVQELIKKHPDEKYRSYKKYLEMINNVDDLTDEEMGRFFAEHAIN